MENVLTRLVCPSLRRPEPGYGTKVIAAAWKQRKSSPSTRRKLPKNLRYPRRAKVPPDPGINRAALLKKMEEPEREPTGTTAVDEEGDGEVLDGSVWSPDEIEVISSLFERQMPQKAVRRRKESAAHVPPPRGARPAGTPAPKRHVRAASRGTLSLRSPVSSRVFKNPEVLVRIAREIGALPAEEDASEVLGRWGPFLRKGSLSMTIKELGHMGLPERALQTLCWAQKHRLLFPDDRILASTVEVLARNGQLKMGAPMERYLSSASRTVMEAMARGFIRAGNVDITRKILLFVRDNKRALDAGVHAKLILEAGKNPDRHRLAEVLLDELGDREDLDLRPQDCTAIMKICIRLGRFEAVESLFDWFKQSRGNPTVVMYTTVVHGRFRSGDLRGALAAVWEMEERDLLLDLPAYRVVIRLCVALGDLARAARYFSRLKEAGFAPTYDIYRDMIRAYAAGGRLAKCRQICRELETAGWKLDRGAQTLLLQIEDGLLSDD